MGKCDPLRAAEETECGGPGWKTGIVEEDAVGKEGSQEIYELLAHALSMVKTPALLRRAKGTP